MNWQLNTVQQKMQEDHMAIADELKSIKDQLEKAKSEIVVKISDLEAAVAAAGEPSAEVMNALADVKALAKGLDDLVVDAPVEDAPVAVEAPAEVPAEVPAEELPAEVEGEEAEEEASE
jgi:hypothetical protein